MIVIENLARQLFFQEDKFYFTSSNNIETCYDLESFTNWMRQNHLKVVKQFFEEERHRVEIKIGLMLIDLGESVSD